MKKISVITGFILAACIPCNAGDGIFHTKSDEDSVRISLILPFDAGTDRPSAKYFDFYSGALTAAEEAASLGIRVAVNVFDFSNSEQKGSYAARRIKESDIVVGPISPEQQEEVQELCKEHNIPFVSPMDQASAPFAETNEYFIQIPASPDTQTDNLIRMMQEDGDGAVTLFYSEESEADKALKAHFEERLTKAEIPYQTFSYAVLQGRTITPQIKQMFQANGAPLQKVILASENVAYASDVIRNLALVLRSGIQVIVYGTNRIRNFEAVDATSFYSLQLRISTPYYVDYGDGATLAFIAAYREKYGTEPTPYAFQGYDIFRYFIRRINELGPSMTDFLSFYPAKGLQNDFHFVRRTNQEGEEEGGYRNIATRDIQYRPDHSVVLH